MILDLWLLPSLLLDSLCDNIALIFRFVLQIFVSSSITGRVISAGTPLPSLVWEWGLESAFKGTSPPTSSVWIADHLEKRPLSVSLGFVPLSPFQDPCPCPRLALITSHLDYSNSCLPSASLSPLQHLQLPAPIFCKYLWHHITALFRSLPWLPQT